jgi:predicted nucleic acid-binding protein
VARRHFSPPLIELADTSAWTTKHRDVTVAAEFDQRVTAREIATCNVVRLELLWTARDESDLRALRTDLESLDDVPINDDTWRRAADVMELLAAAGPLHHRQVRMPDLLVAAAAELAGITVCHYDRDFELIAEITHQPVRAIAPLGSLYSLR